MDQWLTTALKAVARYARAYPLRQIALAAALFMPWTVCLHLAFVATGTEATAIGLVGSWGPKVTAAGLSFLTASVWISLGSYRAARSRKRKRQASRDAASKKLAAERESWRQTIRGLSVEDKSLLRRFVDDRRVQFESEDLVDRSRSGILQRLNSLGILETWWPYGCMTDSVFDLLLAEPALVGSEAAGTARIKLSR